MAGQTISSALKMAGQSGLLQKYMRGAVVLIVPLLVVAGICTAEAQQQRAAPHRVIAPKSLHWTPWLRGAEIAVLQGDSKTEGMFTIRMHARAGTTIPPHSHPTDENLTVLTGSVGIGMGSKIEKAETRKMAPGAFVTLPKGVDHYLICSTDCTLQIHGNGPFVINFVDNGRLPNPKTAN